MTKFADFKLPWQQNRCRRTVASFFQDCINLAHLRQKKRNNLKFRNYPDLPGEIFFDDED
jgi:hypothetical protein